MVSQSRVDGGSASPTTTPEFHTAREPVDTKGAPPERKGGANIPFQITVHNSKEDLQKQVDGVDQHRQQVEPGLARHVG